MSAKTDNWEAVQAQCRSVLPQDIVDHIAAVRKADRAESQLIGVLHKVQGHFGYLGQEHMDAVAQLLQVPAARVSGVATFYHFFRLNQRGRYVINVCYGTACYVNGAAAVSERIRDELGIDFGETTGDGMFSLESARCLGTCGLSPVIMVNDEIHGQVTPDQIPLILKQYRDKAKAQP